MTPEQFIREWQGARSQMDPEVARGLQVPDASRAFLVEAGLPVDVGFRQIGFDLSGKALRRPAGWPTLVQISTEAEDRAPICLDEAAAGRVVQVRTEKGRPRLEFLNSSVEQHANCWLAWRALVTSGKRRDAGMTAALLRRAFQTIDREALSGDHPWSVLVHEIETGSVSASSRS
jgi:hypothetical protein